MYEEEARLGQRFVVDMTLRLDTRRAGLTDELERSVDYGEVCRFVTGRLCGERYRLIEAAAERFAMAVLERWEAVEGLNLELHKPSAPIGLPFSDVSVRIERSRAPGPMSRSARTSATGGRISTSPWKSSARSNTAGC